MVDTLSPKLDAYEAILSKQKYLAGDDYTLADLFVSPYKDNIYYEHADTPYVQRSTCHTELSCTMSDTKTCSQADPTWLVGGRTSAVGKPVPSCCQKKRSQINQNVSHITRAKARKLQSVPR
jgi:hypothetical protein